MHFQYEYSNPPINAQPEKEEMKEMDVTWAKDMDKSLRTLLIQQQVNYMDKFESGLT